MITPIADGHADARDDDGAARQAARAVLHRQHAVADVRAARGGAAHRRSSTPARTPTAFDAKAAAIDAATDGYNAALVAAAAPYPNLHIVDFKQYVADVRGGITVGGERLTATAGAACSRSTTCT